MRFKRGDVILVDLGQSHPKSHTYRGMHPCVIVSSDIYNGKLNLLSVCVLTTKRHDTDRFENHIPITKADVKGYLRTDSTLLIEAPADIDKKYIYNKQGTLRHNEKIMKRIDEQLYKYYFGRVDEDGGKEET